MLGLFVLGIAFHLSVKCCDYEISLYIKLTSHKARQVQVLFVSSLARYLSPRISDR